MSKQIEEISGGEVINGVERLDDFIVHDGLRTRPLTYEEMSNMSRSWDEYLQEKQKEEQRQREEHKQNYINSLIVPGNVEATLRKLAEAIYNLDMGKAERPVYLR